MRGGCSGFLSTVLWIVAVIMFIVGLVRVFGGDILWGIVLIILAFLVGPGGVSLFC